MIVVVGICNKQKTTNLPRRRSYRYKLYLYFFLKMACLQFDFYQIKITKNDRGHLCTKYEDLWIKMEKYTKFSTRWTVLLFLLSWRYVCHVFKWLLPPISEQQGHSAHHSWNWKPSGKCLLGLPNTVFFCHYLLLFKASPVLRFYNIFHKEWLKNLR